MYNNICKESILTGMKGGGIKYLGLKSNHGIIKIEGDVVVETPKLGVTTMQTMLVSPTLLVNSFTAAPSKEPRA